MEAYLSLLVVQPDRALLISGTASGYISRFTFCEWRLRNKMKSMRLLYLPERRVIGFLETIKTPRFKITDEEDEILQEIAYQFYKKGIINKPNIQALGRWSIIEQTLNRYRDFAIQAKIVRYQQQQAQQQQMWQKQQLSSLRMST